MLFADGGTRTASITGAAVALVDALKKIDAESALVALVASVSVGIYNNTPVLDLDYAEDSKAQTDMNVVCLGSGGFIELQGTGEGAPFSGDELQQLIALAEKVRAGAALRKPLWPRGIYATTNLYRLPGGTGSLKVRRIHLKFGARQPYFFNLGAVRDGAGFAQLGRAYADAILAAEIEFDVLFGPAYKGIPIALATATALAERGVHVGVAYNRKEAKDHGEGGMLVGAEVAGQVLLVDDVLTSGKAIRQSVDLIAQTDASIVGAVIALDRAELSMVASPL